MNAGRPLLCMFFLLFFALSPLIFCLLWKITEKLILIPKNDFDQQTACRTLVCWLKYTTSFPFGQICPVTNWLYYELWLTHAVKPSIRWAFVLQLLSFFHSLFLSFFLSFFYLILFLSGCNFHDCPTPVSFGKTIKFWQIQI